MKGIYLICLTMLLVFTEMVIGQTSDITEVAVGEIIIVREGDNIQYWVDYAQPGDTIYFPNGKYVVYSPIIINKPLKLIGSGFNSQIFQVYDDHLFHIKETRWVIMKDMALGSAATSIGKSLLEIEHSAYSRFENIFMRGGYYGVHLKGSLGNVFYGLTNVPGWPFEWTFSKTGAYCSENQYWVYGKRDGNFSVNHTAIIAPVLQGWERGIHIEDNHAEGGIVIRDGLCEGMRKEGIYLKGITAFASISGMHLESGRSSIVLDGCSTGEIRSCYSSEGIQIKNSKLISISGCYAGSYDVDANSNNVIIQNCKFGGRNSLLGENMTITGLVSTGTARINYDSNFGGRIVNTKIVNIPSRTSQPDVANANIFKTLNASKTVINGFSNGKEGQSITVIFGDSHTTIDFTDTVLRGNSGMDWSPNVGDHMDCLLVEGVWYCTLGNNTSQNSQGRVPPPR